MTLHVTAPVPDPPETVTGTAAPKAIESSTEMSSGACGPGATVNVAPVTGAAGL